MPASGRRLKRSSTCATARIGPTTSSPPANEYIDRHPVTDNSRPSAGLRRPTRIPITPEHTATWVRTGSLRSSTQSARATIGTLRRSSLFGMTGEDGMTTQPPPQLDFRGLATRVPCLIISPYAREGTSSQGYVSHTQYEFGSILRFIEDVYDLPYIGPPSQGYTDGRANSLVDSFDFPNRLAPLRRSDRSIRRRVHQRARLKRTRRRAVGANRGRRDSNPQPTSS